MVSGYTTTLPPEVFTQRNFAAEFDALRHYAYVLNVYFLRSHTFGDQILNFMASKEALTLY